MARIYRGQTRRTTRVPWSYDSRIVNLNFQLEDLRVFCLAARKASFAATATELETSPAYVSKRIAVLEKSLGGSPPGDKNDNQRKTSAHCRGRRWRDRPAPCRTDQ